MVLTGPRSAPADLATAAPPPPMADDLDNINPAAEGQPGPATPDSTEVGPSPATPAATSDKAATSPPRLPVPETNEQTEIADWPALVDSGAVEILLPPSEMTNELPPTPANSAPSDDLPANYSFEPLSFWSVDGSEKAFQPPQVTRSYRTSRPPGRYQATMSSLRTSPPIELQTVTNLSVEA